MTPHIHPDYSEGPPKKMEFELFGNNIVYDTEEHAVYLGETKYRLPEDVRVTITGDFGLEGTAEYGEETEYDPAREAWYKLRERLEDDR